MQSNWIEFSARAMNAYQQTLTHVTHVHDGVKQKQSVLNIMSLFVDFNSISFVYLTWKKKKEFALIFTQWN